jgi:hypothetical protein
VNAAPRRPHTVLDAGLRLMTAAALVIDAVLHLQLARLYNLAAPGGIGEGTLFRFESAAALVAAAVVLAYGSRTSYGIAFLIAGSATVAAVLYRYVDVPALGPIPAMYEPVWFGKKVIATAAEAAGTLTAAAGCVTAQATARRTPHGRRSPARIGLKP